MSSRLVEPVRLRWSLETQLSLTSSFLKVPGGGNPGKMLVKFEHRAMLNGGELIRCVLHDPYFAMVNPPVGPNSDGETYYDSSRIKAPINIKSVMQWAGAGDLKTPVSNHALAGLAPYNTSGSNSGQIEFIGVDYGTWHLNAGDAGGYRYKGNIKDVIEQVVKKYSRGQLEVEFRTKTKDSTENQWWQYRLDPKSFILSLLEWSTSINNMKTRWLIYSDDEEKPGKIIFVEQADVTSIHRATYHWKGFEDSKQGFGDIMDWEMIGDNALQLVRHKVVTSGISSVSGAWFDRINPGPEKVVYVGDVHTPNKYKPITSAKNAFTRPEPESDPLQKSVGWTSVPSIPELSAGEMGLKYDEYLDGIARNWYSKLDTSLMKCRFRIVGHHIWAGTEGLGVDTIDIIMHNAKDGSPHFLKGNWIVYGYHHQMTSSKWFTDLYCYRLDFDASARGVGKKGK